jgi:hypothetical protein
LTSREAILQAAVRGDLAGLLALASLEEIADPWWRYTIRGQERRSGGRPSADWDDDPDGWASEVCCKRVIHDDEDTLRRFIRLLAERAPAETDLGFLGAGPLEDFIVNDEDRLRWVEEAAARSPHFRGALANIWIEGLYRVTVPVNVWRTGELGFGPYTASLFPLPPSPSNSPVPLTIVHTPLCGV